MSRGLAEKTLASSLVRGMDGLGPWAKAVHLGRWPHIKRRRKTPDKGQELYGWWAGQRDDPLVPGVFGTVVMRDGFMVDVDLGHASLKHGLAGIVRGAALYVRYGGKRNKRYVYECAWDADTDISPEAQRMLDSDFWVCQYQEEEQFRLEAEIAADAEVDAFIAQLVTDKGHEAERFRQEHGRVE